MCPLEVLTGKERHSRDGNGEARTLKKYAHQRKTTRSNNDSLQLQILFGAYDPVDKRVVGKESCNRKDVLWHVVDVGKGTSKV